MSEQRVTATVVAVEEAWTLTSPRQLKGVGLVLRFHSADDEAALHDWKARGGNAGSGQPLVIVHAGASD